MSFKENLQHLRRASGMTQERLAEVLGVSRQSVTKWESGRSTPEMDKLIKMCGLFGCTLDELVTGEVARPAEGDAAAEPVGHFELPGEPAARADGKGGACGEAGPRDASGYEGMQRMMARRVPAGVLCFVASPAFLALGNAGGSIAGLRAESAGFMAFLACVVVGIALVVPAGMEYAAFARMHPVVDDPYTEDDRRRARRAFARGLVTGIALIFAGMAAPALLPSAGAPAAAAFFLFAAAGVFCIVRYGMLLGRVNVAAYSREALAELDASDIERASLDEETRAEILVRKREHDRIGSACGAIMIAATIVGLTLLFVPAFGAREWFWVSWVIGGLLCALASTLMKALGAGERR